VADKVGLRGLTGLTGLRGLTGLTGLTGLRGLTGLTGLTTGQVLAEQAVHNPSIPPLPGVNAELSTPSAAKGCPSRRPGAGSTDDHRIPAVGSPVDPA